MVMIKKLFIGISEKRFIVTVPMAYATLLSGYSMLNYIILASASVKYM